MSLDYNVVMYACRYSIFGAITAGFFGFYIGKVLESASYSHNRRNNTPIKKPNNRVQQSTPKETAQTDTDQETVEES